MKPSLLLMIRPAAFGFNPETAATNSFQQHSNAEALNERARSEFDVMTGILQQHEIGLIIIEDENPPLRPDAVFPNNWFSVHPGKMILYPMLAPNRRLEIRSDIIDMLCEKFDLHEVHELRQHVSENHFLEGTGSLVFCDAGRKAYAALSPRTNQKLVLDVCAITGYEAVCFETIPLHGTPVYHTNVMMSLHPRIAVVCSSLIAPPDRDRVMHSIREQRETIVEISPAQVSDFAGNMLFVRNSRLEEKLIVSERAWNSLDNIQQKTISAFAEPVIIPLRVIEETGGGSVRCMLAEIDRCFGD